MGQQIKKEIGKKNKIIQGLRMRQWNKWYYRSSEDDALKPYDEDINKQLNWLSVGGAITVKLKNTKYSITKTFWNKGEQKNTTTHKKRDILSMNLNINDAPSDKSRVSEQRWYYKKSDGTLLPYTESMNQRMKDAVIGDIVTFSAKNQKYSVAKKSWNTGEQINLSTKKKRYVFSQYELAINDENKEEDDIFNKLDAFIHDIEKKENEIKDELNKLEQEKEATTTTLRNVKDMLLEITKKEKKIERDKKELEELRGRAPGSKQQKLQKEVNSLKQKLNETEISHKKQIESLQRINLGQNGQNGFSENRNDELIEEIRQKKEIIDGLTISNSDLQNEMNVILKFYRFGMLFVVLLSAMFVAWR